MAINDLKSLRPDNIIRNRVPSLSNGAFSLSDYTFRDYRTGPTIKNRPLDQVVGAPSKTFEQLVAEQQIFNPSVRIGDQTFKLGNFASTTLSRETDQTPTGGDINSPFNAEDTWTTELTDYRNVYTPGRNNISNDNVVGTQYGLDDFQWYPEEMTRFYEDDFFQTADEQFDFQEPGGQQGFIGMKINEVRNEINDYVKQIGKVKDTIVDIAGNVKEFAGEVSEFLFGDRSRKRDTNIDDYKSLVSNNPLFKSVPVINITEIQPRSDLAFQFEIFNQISELASSFAEGSFRDTGNKLSAFGRALKEVFVDIAGSRKNNDYFDVFTLPNLFYTRLVGGKVRAKYTVPLSPQETYWHAKGSDGWESRTFIQQTFGSFGSKLIKLLPGIQQVDIQGRPKFTAPTEGHAEFETTFTLFNYNMDAVKKNVRFINSIIAGAWWTQVGFVQQASNLYDIKVPGRFRYFFCSADIKVDQVGKVRKLNDKQINDVLSVLEKPNAVDENEGQMPLNPEIIQFIPDTYRITMTFKSLMPNNLNSYLNFVYARNPQKGLQEDLPAITTDKQFKELTESVVSGDFNSIRDSLGSLIGTSVSTRNFGEFIPDIAKNFRQDKKKIAGFEVPNLFG
tara:strand:- start:27727 stop:29583 length:1857 start_codon:yes stop_codon:yes gene_type:complete